MGPGGLKIADTGLVEFRKLWLGGQSSDSLALTPDLN